MTATDSDLDLLDYTAQAQQLVADFKRLKSAASVFEEASESLFAGRAAIDKSGATLADRSDMALLIYEDALHVSKQALAEAVGRMDAAKALATQSGAILDDLQQLQDASRALTGARATMEQAATLLDGHADALQAGAAAYRDAIHDGAAAQEALAAGRHDLLDARGGLDTAAGRIEAASAELSRQADLSGQGTEHLLRAAAGLGGALGDLTASRDSLAESQSRLVVAANQLSAAHDRALADATTLEAATQQLAQMRGTLEAANATLADAAMVSAEQARIFAAAGGHLGKLQEVLAFGLADILRQQQTANDTLRALTNASQTRTQQMQDRFDRLDAHLSGLPPVINKLARTEEQLGPQLDRNAKHIEAAVAAALRVQGDQHAAALRAQAEQLAAIQEKMRLVIGVAGGVLLAVLATMAFIVTRGG